MSCAREIAACGRLVKPLTSSILHEMKNITRRAPCFFYSCGPGSHTSYI